MISQDIRRQFLAYFQSKEHALIPSSPVIPHEDPTLLFVNAGMNQFKDIFLGKRVSDYESATTSQKCIRVGGKHNDLENVGHTSRHLTFFEMLGNFSFGDYFKKEAIDFAWEVTTSIFKYDIELLWATVFHQDEEAFELWKRYLPEGRIVRRGEKDNFWSMGDTGPCGPCSELLYDRGVKFSTARNPSEDVEEERYIEFWNLVFVAFNRDISGDLHSLPRKCIDTGAGLERVVSLKMGVDSLFETDILRALIAQVERLSNKKYNPEGKEAAAFRVIADHLRSLAFAIADGVQPSNIERGYVLRKVLRRAMRYGRKLGLDKPFLADLLPSLLETMGDDFPELSTSKERIAEILTLEEESFLRTLRRGGNLMNQVVIEAKKREGQISGDDAFKLKDTYGFPLEEILLLANDDGLSVDIHRFEELAHEAKERSRGARKTVEQEVSSVYEMQGPSIFLGYQQTAADAVVIGLMKQDEEITSLQAGEEGSVFLDQTPFYAEMGGQVGDQGAL
ncbi:MAG: alanine--tRNA ligase, partial [Chlamydiales bacterium]